MRSFGSLLVFMLPWSFAYSAQPPVDEDGRPKLERLGTVVAWPIGECTPIVFKDKLYRYEWIHHVLKGDKPRNYSRIVDEATGKATAPFAVGSSDFGSAFVDGDTVYVTTSTGQGVRVFASKNLDHWDSWIALDLPGFGIYNTSVCKAPDKYVMMFEIDRPKEQAGVPFTARFAFSKDMRHWEVTPPECVYAKDRYTAPHCLRYCDGYYYDFYLEACPGWFETRVVRSRDFVHWEASPLNPVLRPSDEDKKIANPALTAVERERIARLRSVNTSDLDLCEHQGQVIVLFCWGNQTDEGNLAKAVYRGTLEQFLKGWFPAKPHPSAVVP
jgi:hypothetical protein